MELDDVVPLTVKPVKRLREAGRPGAQIPSVKSPTGQMAGTAKSSQRGMNRAGVM